MLLKNIEGGRNEKNGEESKLIRGRREEEARELGSTRVLC